MSGRDAKRMCCRRMKLGHEDSTALLIAESGPPPASRGRDGTQSLVDVSDGGVGQPHDARES